MRVLPHSSWDPSGEVATFSFKQREACGRLREYEEDHTVGLAVGRKLCGSTTPSFEIYL